MSWKIVAATIAAIGVISLFGLGAWLLTLRPAAATVSAPAIDPRETAALLAALQPPKRERPLIAIIGINDATETTDYLMPYGILRRADVADVVTLATEPGPVRLYPALQVEPDATIAAFDAEHPEGADYVIVPAMSRDDDPAALAWIRAQAANGAIIIAVCAGARVVAEAGLLDGREATTHWYYLANLLKRHPTIRYVKNRRFVGNDGMVTTTGITASMPMMLTLIEAIAGREKADAVAADLGVTRWDGRHASDAFRLTRPFALTVLGNRLAIWNRDRLGIELRPGMDEVSLALVADAWSRTYRSQALTFAGSTAPVETRNGARILPDRMVSAWPADRVVAVEIDERPAIVLDDTLRVIGDRYGDATANVVAMQLEYPR